MPNNLLDEELRNIIQTGDTKLAMDYAIKNANDLEVPGFAEAMTLALQLENNNARFCKTGAQTLGADRVNMLTRKAEKTNTALNKDLKQIRSELTTAQKNQKYNLLNLLAMQEEQKNAVDKENKFVFIVK